MIKKTTCKCWLNSCSNRGESRMTTLPWKYLVMLLHEVGKTISGRDFIIVNDSIGNMLRETDGRIFKYYISWPYAVDLSFIELRALSAVNESLWTFFCWKHKVAFFFFSIAVNSLPSLTCKNSVNQYEHNVSFPHHTELFTFSCIYCSGNSLWRC